MEGTTSLISYDSHSAVAKIHSPIKPSKKPVFILCDRCYWCATYFDNRRLPTDNNCPQCNTNSSQLTSFPIAPNESFIYNYNEKRGVELEFKHRRSL
jgi:predicted Zn-ribbon and HTH transcriptional regulator